jgi:putative transposase
MIRKRHSADFKAKVAMEALKGTKTVNELAGEIGVHPTQISQWKRQLEEGSKEIFQNGHSRKAKDAEALNSSLYEEIGRLKMELSWLKKKAALFS